MKIVNRNYYDWEWLRKEIKDTWANDIAHLSAQMPSESSSVVSNATNGMNHLEII